MQMCKNVNYDVSMNPPNCTWINIIGYPRDFHVNYAHLNGFLRNVFLQLSKALQTSFLQRTSQKTFLNWKFVIDMIN